MVIAGSSLIAIVLIGPVGGYETHNFWAGFPRVGFDFFGGVILYKIYFHIGGSDQSCFRLLY